MDHATKLNDSTRTQEILTSFRVTNIVRTDPRELIFNPLAAQIFSNAEAAT